MEKTMNIEQTVLEKMRTLSPDKQQEVIDFIEFLQHKSGAKQPRRSLKGLWADLEVDLTAEDITEIRKEMWKNFPREDI
jgi:hypothetical protein